MKQPLGYREARRFIVPAVLSVALVAGAIVWRKPLVAWFSPPATTARAKAASSAHVDSEKRPTQPAITQVTFSSAALASLELSQNGYEEIRKKLAADSIADLAPSARRASDALAAAKTDDLPKEVAATLQRASESAKAVGEAKDLATARARFSELSQSMFALATADPRLQNGKHAFSCPMVNEGEFNKWFQPNDKLENPYMGTKMAECGSAAKWQDEAPKHDEAHSDEIAFYTCPMHPSVKQPEPGKCPICGMALTPVKQEELASGIVRIDAARRQLIGVKLAKVETRDIDRGIRAVGKITVDETRLVDVSLKFKGWVKNLVANSVGKRIRRGQTLFTVYSPEVFAAEQELLLASASRRTLDGGVSRPGSLVDAARMRLELWDVPKSVVDKLEKGGKPMKYVPIASPASGFIVEKNVFEGSAVEPGMRLLRIANLDKVWIEAELYEAELPLVTVGKPATITLTYLPDKKLEGKVKFVYPYLDPETRTGRVRIELDNRDIELKPDMYANVEIPVERGKRLVVPESAVIYAGTRRIVFVDIGDDKLEPREVKVGLRSGDYYEITSGLALGDQVVVSGNFLVAADSRLKRAW